MKKPSITIDGFSFLCGCWLNKPYKTSYLIATFLETVEFPDLIWMM